MTEANKQNSIESEVCTPYRCCCDSPDNCAALQKHKKLVYCSFYDCLHNVPIRSGKFVANHRFHTPLGDDVLYRGVCGRAELALQFADYSTYGQKILVAKCAVRSDREISGHMDFSRFLKSDGTPYGGLLPDQMASDRVSFTSGRYISRKNKYGQKKKGASNKETA